MKIEELNRLVKLAKEKNIEIKNTPEGKKILEQLKNSKRDGKSVSANSISDKDVAKMKEMLSGFTENKPQYKGLKGQLKKLKKTASTALGNNKSANSISNRDVDLIKKSFGMKKGGVVKYNRGGSVSNFKGCY